METPIIINLLAIFSTLSAGMNIIQMIILWKSRKSTIKDTEAKALDSMGNTFDQMSARVDKEIEKYVKIIENQDQRIKKQDEKIATNYDETQKTKKLLDQYINQCETCANNKIKVK